MAAFELGSEVRRTISFKDATGNLVDPATVTVTLTLPDATTASPSPTRYATGIYTYLFTTALAGRHVELWNASL